MQYIDAIAKARRPIILIGGGMSRAAMGDIYPLFESYGMPIMTTWNGMDRIDWDHPLYFGRPNTWGMRYSNLLIQQCDLLIAVGTRLGLQQTGFNWQEFAPLAKIIHVDIDDAELTKGHPKTDFPICMDAAHFLRKLLLDCKFNDYPEWVTFCNEVKARLPVAENTTKEGYQNPYDFINFISKTCTPNDCIVPCSSGNAFTAMMQSFRQKRGQTIITNKGLAAMGYGLAGAIGCAMLGKRTILVEGDGGFAQNLQELGTVRAQNLPIKMFIFDDGGYSSIRSTQRNYFKENYIGCDLSTDLGLPDWEKIFSAYSIHVWDNSKTESSLNIMMQGNYPAAFILRIDPEQTYYPKISSRILPNGGMESNPLHLMTPSLTDEQFKKYGKYLCKQ